MATFVLAILGLICTLASFRHHFWMENVSLICAVIFYMGAAACLLQDLTGVIHV